MSSASSGAKPEVPVSVVLPCYNAQACVRRAIESVEAQTVRPLEILAVDDGSTDSTGEILEALAAEYSPGWLKVLRLDRNRGPASARNAGWNAAAGQWVAFLDADDTWHPRKLEVQVDAFRDHPSADLIAHRHELSNSPSKPGNVTSQGKVVTAAALLTRNRFVTPSVMLRRDISERFEEGRRHMEDHLLWLEMAYAGRMLILLEERLVTLHKPAFGASGLSANLLAMEKAEISNYRLLWHRGHLPFGLFLILCIWSGAKFVRRLLVVILRRVRIG